MSRPLLVLMAVPNGAFAAYLWGFGLYPGLAVFNSVCALACLAVAAMD